MGQQYGEALRAELRRAIEHFVPWLLSDVPKTQRVAATLRQSIGTEFREVLDEIEGMARGANLPQHAVVLWRFLPEISTMLEPGCTVAFIASSDCGPILGRNEDIEPDLSVEIQVCRTTRPENGPASLLLTYAGLMATGVGMNEHGLAIGGASAHTDKRFGSGGLPNSLASHIVLHRSCDVADAHRQLASHTFRGKPSVSVVADASGRSMLLEMMPGAAPLMAARAADRDWQICTNFFVASEELMSRGETEYLQNGYARYGRLMHRLADVPMPRTAANLQALMSEVAAPGLCLVEKDLKFFTAYTTLMELNSRRLRVSEGHPSQGRYREVQL